MDTRARRDMPQRRSRRDKKFTTNDFADDVVWQREQVVVRRRPGRDWRVAHGPENTSSPTRSWGSMPVRPQSAVPSIAGLT